MDQVERVEPGGGHRDGAVDAAPALLEALEGDGTIGEVHAVAGQGQGLADAAAGGVQDVAGSPHLTRRAGGRFEKCRPLFRRQAAMDLVALLRGWGGSAARFGYWQTSTTARVPGAGSAIRTKPRQQRN